MKSIASVLSIIALGFGLLGCPSDGGVSTPAFAVSTTTADFGVVGNTYTSTLAATGGTAPFTWTRFGGVLPSGLSLNAGTGIVSGTLGAPAGNFNVTFTVTDSTGQTATGSVLFAIHTRTDRVSVDSSGTAGNGASNEPVINSTDGRFIAFTSLAALTALPGGSGSQIFVHDRQTSLPRLVSRDNLGSASNGASSQPAISADGRFVAFTSVATNLALTPGAIGSQIFLRDTQNNTTTLVSRDAVGNAGNGASSHPTISADGQFVAFTSVATNLASIIGGSGSQIFLRDTVGNTTTLVSREIGGNAGDGASSQPAISATTGQFVAFTSLATNLAAIPGGSGSQIYLRDTQGNQTSLVSKDNNLPANAGNGASGAPAVVGDGGFVAFASLASTLASGPNAGSQVYVRALP
jgi:Tol biopolymer transport system component